MVEVRSGEATSFAGGDTDLIIKLIIKILKIFMILKIILIIKMIVR